MKKIFTTLFMVMGIYAITHAQNKSNGSEFGIGVGLNGSYVTASNQTSDAIAGLNVNLSYEHYYSNRWGLKIKAIYDQKGWSNGVITFGTKTYTGVNYKLNYITVPVMANWHFGRTRNWYLNFGPYIGYLAGASVNQFNADVKDFFHSVDGGLDAGIGVKIPVSQKSKFFIEYDGQSGVTGIFKDVVGSNPLISRASLNIGLTF